jgi:hypothetical protein
MDTERSGDGPDHRKIPRWRRIPAIGEIIEASKGWRETCGAIRAHPGRSHGQHEFVSAPQRQRKLVAHLADGHRDLAPSARCRDGHITSAFLGRLGRKEYEQLHLPIRARHTKSKSVG